MPKIFIIHASAGLGHKMVAESINELAVDSYGKNSVRVIDILDHTSFLFKTIYSKGYIFAISNLVWVWSILFFLSDTKYLSIINNNLRRFSNKIFCQKFLNFLKNEDPDVIISTHFLVNELVSLLKENGEIKTKLISMVTDFGVHNFWIAKNVDIYATACNHTKDILISKKVESKKIKVLGIPVRKQFQRTLERKRIREKLGFKTDGFTSLILAGGIGIGPIYEIVKLLNDNVNVVVVCGNNKKLSERLKRLSYQNLVVLGWIDYVEEVMAASDIIITKPGGSTISECLIMDLPMIFFSIIPGQEFQNSQIISRYGFGFILKNSEDIRGKVFYFKENPEEIKAIRDRISKFKNKDSSRRILELIND